MGLPLYQIDAFASAVFRGNPAGVCPLTAWPDERLMQAIAAENNLAETAFFVAEGEDFRMRWFTPAVEVDLCGHATLASGWLILHRLQPQRRQVTFHTRSGPLTVRREGEKLEMSLPAWPPKLIAAPPNLAAALGRTPTEVWHNRYYLAVFERASDVRTLKPDMAGLAALGDPVCVTAPGEDGFDCLSRFFAPRAGIPEDPATGSAHCLLAPYWGARLGKPRLKAFQASARGGEMVCHALGARVAVQGDCALYLEGTIHV